MGPGQKGPGQKGPVQKGPGQKVFLNHLPFSDSL
jgi:hypothetical protein